MYDPLETDLSLEYLKKIINKSKNLKIALVGGWATFFYVNNEYKKAFGVDYIKSRDIDLYIDPSSALNFKKIINKLGFQKSGYYFRYELIYDRTEKKIIDIDSSKNKPMYNLIYIFLDLFSARETEINVWPLSFLKDTKIININKIPIIDINTLIKLKTFSFFEREKLDKELKDACDIYALIFYPNKRIKLDKNIKKALEKILTRNDLSNFIAENVLLDTLKVGIVKQNIKNLLSRNYNVSEI